MIKNIIRIVAKNRLSFVISTVAYIIGSLFLINYFYVGISNFFTQNSAFFISIELLLMAFIALLFGANISLIINEIRLLRKLSWNGLFSSLISLVGIGCPACTLSIVVAVIPGLASIFTIAVLPLRGIEIQLVVLIILITSTWFTLKKIRRGISYD